MLLIISTLIIDCKTMKNYYFCSLKLNRMHYD